MIVYHGSKKEISLPKVGGSNPKNDYGPSFYTTLDLESAKEWACRNGSVGIVNKYSIKKSAFESLKILDLTDKSRWSILNWVAILMHFRSLDSSFIKNYKAMLEWLEKYYVDVSEYDVVIGFRADDSYFRFPIRFITNDLSFEMLESVYLLGDLGIQYAFMSEKAFKALELKGVVECDKDFIGRYFNTINEATRRFDEILSEPKDPSKTYIMDLVRKDYGK